MFPLPEPERGGKIKEFLKFLNLAAREDEVLCPNLAGRRVFQDPHPILALHGMQGSGKTTIGTVIRRLVDPAKAHYCPLLERARSGD